MNKDEIYQRIKDLFPLSYDDDKFSFTISKIKKELSNKLKVADSARYSGDYTEKEYLKLSEEYSKLSDNGEEYVGFLSNLVDNLFSGVPRWRSPKIMYNICAASNLAASVAYTLGLEDNIHNVNNGLSGNTLVAEKSVVSILSKLADIKSKPYGLFTFGGTSTNLYAIKMGIKKCHPESSFTGVDGKTKVLLTEDCHFSHASNADWLGVGLDNVVTIEANRDRTSNVDDFRTKASQILKSGFRIGAIILNGGTTYGHTIDDIEAFVQVRDQLVIDHNLGYKPHIHIDSVIGWSWLVFRGYNFEENKLEIEKTTLQKIKLQYQRISKINKADSWGVDFHKGIGSTPAISSMIMANSFEDISILSKKVSSKTETHQLAQEFSTYSPVDYTLETTRASGSALAALTTLHVLGLNGLRRNLANLVELTTYMRSLIEQQTDIVVANNESNGFVTMVRLLPPGIQRKGIYEYTNEENLLINRYLNNFFKWDKTNRIDKGDGVEYSVSSSYLKINSSSIAAIKLYPTSPHFSKTDALEAVNTIINQKEKFDSQKLEG
jgi:glutamate/tyrosine decarboxylase-like PLP-dependent enzyme